MVLVGKTAKSVVSNLIHRYEGEDEEPSCSENQSLTPQKNANRKKLKGVNGEVRSHVEEMEQEIDKRSAAPFEGDRRAQ